MNLVNDPLLNENCKYIILRDQYIEDTQFKTEPYDPEYFYIPSEELDVEREEINKAFFDLLEDLNKDNVFYFSCPFINYSLNFESRVSEFLNKYNDTTAEDFISYEINFLENIMNDIQNSESARDDFSLSGKVVFEKASPIVKLIGYDQFYYSTVKKIKYLEQKKNEVNNPKRTSYNHVLLECKSPEIEKLFINILHNGISLYNAIDQINKMTTPETYVLFLYEFETIYHHLLCSFMSSIEVSTIEQALDVFDYELEYVYVAEEDMPKLGSKLRNIGKFKTVYNIFDLSKEKKPDSIEIVHLNNLMIDYYNGFFESPKKEFEHMIELKTVYNYLNNEYINKYFGKTTLHTDITKALPENNEPDKVDLENLDNEKLKESIYYENNNDKTEAVIINKENPHPKIFKDYKAFNIFTKLLNAFKNTNENLSNYSFVFHKMSYEGLIHSDLKHLSYFEFLDKFEINISRIKPLSDIGKMAYRESIYTGAK